jgi:cell division protein FtsW
MRARALFVATAVALAMLCALQVVTLLRAPAAWSPTAISVDLKPGESITLGQQELAAPQADRRQLLLQRDADGRWFAASANGAHAVALQRGEREQRIGSVAPQAGHSIRLGAAQFHIDAASADAIAFSNDAHHWRYDGATLWRDGLAQAPCPESRLSARAAALWNRNAPTLLAMARPMSFGGNLHCDNRLGLPMVAPASATLARADGRLLLRGADADAEHPALLVGAPGREADPALAQEALAGDIDQPAVAALTAGRTRLALHMDGERLVLRPSRHVALFSDTVQPLPPQVRWTWQQRDPWRLPVGTPLLVVALLCALLAVWCVVDWQHGRWPFTPAVAWPQRCAAFASACLAIAGIGALLMQRSGTPPGIGISVVLAALACWCCLLQPGRLPLITAAALVLLAVGLQSQLELGLGGGESSMLRYYQKTVALLAIGLGIGCHLRLRLHRRTSVLPQSHLEWMLAALAACALLALMLQVLFGDETGVFELQPVEFAKIALTALTAHCIAVGLGWPAAAPSFGGRALRWCRMAAPALLFLALLGLALVQVDDYSPLVLLMVWSLSMALAYAIAARKLVLGAALLSLACTAAFVVGWLHLAGAASVAQWGFYADRFLVWLEPAQHPHTGQQLLLGARAIAQGAWFGADGHFGLASLGQAAGSVLRVPAVQDDFAPSFFLNRHGLAAALGLWLLQALFLVALLQTAAQSYLASLRARDFRQAWQGRFRCFVLCGGGAFVLGQLLLSWGTNLSIFPIMGQPMSFLSAGGSHLLFFICPLLAMGAISAQSFEENPPCRSTYNTKF